MFLQQNIFKISTWTDTVISQQVFIIEGFISQDYYIFFIILSTVQFKYSTVQYSRPRHYAPTSSSDNAYSVIAWNWALQIQNYLNLKI